jgi:hypothetical protein
LKAWSDKKSIITVADIEALVEKQPHIFDKIATQESSLK